MANLNPRELKEQSNALLSPRQQNARRVVLVYIGAAVLLSLISSGLNLFLEYQIGDTGGLSGLGARSMLQTFQTVLQYAISLFTPFWQAGFLFAALRFAAGDNAGVKDLLAGLRRFSPVLGYYMWSGLIILLAGMAVSNISSVLFSLTPLSDEAFAILLPIMESGTIDYSTLSVDTLLPAFMPMFLIFFALMIPVTVYLGYCMRLAPYLIMDETKMRGFASIVASFNLMKGHKRQMLKLDLSYWWFYLLEAVLVVVCYLDQLLPLIGVELSADPTVAYFIALSIYGVLELALHLWKKAEVDTAYALAYRRIIAPAQPE